MESVKKDKKEKKQKKVEVEEEEEEQVDTGKKSKTDLRAQPLPDKATQKEILELIHQAVALKKVKKGANEATKTLNRGQSDLIVIAADPKPLEIILHLILTCEEKNVPYVFVESQQLIGRACDVSRPVIACSILTDTPDSFKTTLDGLKNKIEKIPILNK